MANPFDLEFEEMLPSFQVDPGSQCTVYEGAAPAPFPGGSPMPTSSIRLDQAWGVRFVWTTSGPLNFLIAGTWELRVYLEQMGAGEFGLADAYGKRIVPCLSQPNTYAVDLAVPAGVVPEGAYQVVTTVKMKGPGGFGGPISAVGNGPILEFYPVG